MCGSRTLPVGVPIALRLDFAAGPVWIIAACKAPGMQEVSIAGDEIVVVFTAGRISRSGSPSLHLCLLGDSNPAAQPFHDQHHVNPAMSRDRSRAVACRIRYAAGKLRHAQSSRPACLATCSSMSSNMRSADRHGNIRRYGDICGTATPAPVSLH